MKKKYGGSETLLELIVAKSKYKHTVDFAQGISKTQSDKFYERIIKDFQAYFQNRKNKDSIIHAHFIFAGHAAQEAGLPTVCSSHCLFSEEFKLAVYDAIDDSEKEELKEAAKFFNNLELLLYPEQNNLLVHSEFHRKEVEKLGGHPRVLKLPLAVSDFNLTLTKHEAKKSVGIPDKFTALFLGRPTYLKGFTILVEAFQILKNRKQAQLLVVGDFELQNKKICYTPCVNSEKEINKISLTASKDIFIVPPVNHKDIPLYFAAADVLVCPSFYESIGYVNLEAMAAGTAVIGSDTAGIPFIVKHNETGLLFKTGDAKDLAKKIEEIMDETMRQRLVNNGKDFVQKYDVKKVLPEYDSLYEEVFHG